MADPAKFWNKIAEKYSRQPVADEAAYQKKLEETRRHFTPETEVLEVGCGTGSTAIAHAPYVRHIRATDLSPKMIDIAKAKAKDANVDNVTFEVAGLDDLRQPGESVDAVLMLSLLHLLDDRRAGIAEAWRALKPGGVFVTSTACLGDTMAFFKFIAPVGRFFGLIPLVRIFTQRELKESMTSAGFSIEHEWRPEKAHAVFIIAKKQESANNPAPD